MTHGDSFVYTVLEVKTVWCVVKAMQLSDVTLVFRDDRHCSCLHCQWSISGSTSNATALGLLRVLRVLRVLVV